MRKLPVITPIDGIDVKSVFGQPLFGMYQQMMRLLLVDPRGKHLQHFFAEPRIQKADGAIHWYTRAEGQIRPWNELTPTEQHNALEIVDHNCRLIGEICEQLLQSQGQSSVTVEAFRSMLITPGLQASLCVVGKSVVLAQWGCRPFGSAASEFSLEVQGKRATQFDASRLNAISDEQESPQVVPMMDSSPADAPEQPIPEPRSDEPYNEETTIPEPERSFLWRWVVILSLLALLLIGLFLKSCTPADMPKNTIGSEELGQLANLIASADEKLLQCRPPAPVASSTDVDNTPILTPDAFVRKDIGVFSGSWILQPESGLVITNEKGVDSVIAMWRIDFDKTGNGTTLLQVEDGRRCTGTSHVLIESSDSFRMSLSPMTCNWSGSAISANQAQCQVTEGGRVANCVLRCPDGPCGGKFLRN